MISNLPRPVTLSSEERILTILDPDAVFRDPKAEGRERVREYVERKRKEKADERQRTG